MVKSEEQARRIQHNRVSNDKPGWAKAVRRWAIRESKGNWRVYRQIINSLPHILPNDPSAQQEHQNEQRD